MEIYMGVTGIIILGILIEMVIVIRTMIITKLDCNITTILKLFLLIPVLMISMFAELCLYAIKIGGK